MGRPIKYKTEEERRQAILEQKREYNRTHREERAAYMKQWRKENAKHVNEYNLEYNKKASASRRQRYHNDPEFRERVKENNRQYVKKHRKEINERHREYRQAYYKKYYQEHKIEILANQKKKRLEQKS